MPAVPCHPEIATNAPEPRAAGRPRVLVVEDDDLSRASVLALLDRFDVEVVAAVDGQAALDRIDLDRRDRDPFDLVLMDLGMPVLDGFEATRAIRLREGVDPSAAPGPRVPVVAMAADSGIATQEACAGWGIDDVIVKPVEREDLEVVCERWLGLLPASIPMAAQAIAAIAGTNMGTGAPDGDAAEIEALAPDPVNDRLLRVLRGEVDRLEEQIAAAIECLEGEQRVAEFGVAGHALAVVAAGLRAREVEEIAVAVAREANAGGRDLAMLTVRAAGVLLAIGRLRVVLDRDVLLRAA